jgi:hypothetical protein
VKQGHLATWPGLAEDAIAKHKRRQNIHSTSKEMKVISDLENAKVTPVGTGKNTHLVYAVVIDQGQLYNFLTGIFPQRSGKVNWYVMVVYSFD